MKRQAFTWIEAVVVLGVVLFLAVLVFPMFIHSHNPNSAKRSSCQSNLKQIGLGALTYIQDYDNKLPLVSSENRGWAESLQPYLKSVQLFQCPSAALATQSAFSSDYFYNARLAGQLVKKPSKMPQTIMFGDGQDNAGTNAHIVELPFEWSRDDSSPRRRHLDGANYAFVDGHVKWYNFEKMPSDVSFVFKM